MTTAQINTARPHLQEFAVKDRVDRHRGVDPLRAQAAVSDEGHVVRLGPLDDVMTDGKGV